MSPFCPYEMIERQRSQLLGLLVLAVIVLLVACFRYCFKLG
jgi:hypothetical protein